MFKAVFDENTKITSEGDLPTHMFMLMDGKIKITYSDGTVFKKLEAGSIFSYICFLLNCPAIWNITTTKPCICLIVPYSTFREILGRDYNIAYRNIVIRNILYKDKYFSKIATAIDDNILNEFEYSIYKKNEIVVEANTKLNETLMIVLEGEIYDDMTKKRLRNIYGDIFFVDNIFNNIEKINEKPLRAHITSFVAKISRAKLINLLGGSFKDIIENIIKNEFCRKINIFKFIPDKFLSKISAVLNTAIFNCTTIYDFDTPGEMIYLINRGFVEITSLKDQKITLKHGQAFGERALISNSKMKEWAKSIGTVECYTLSKKNFDLIFDDEQRLKNYVLERVIYFNEYIDLEDFEIMEENKKVYNNEGKNFVCRHNETKSLYYIKIFDKRLFEIDNYYKSIKMMKTTMNKLDHPFIGKLVKTTKDKNFIFFIEEYINGFDMFEILENVSFLNYELTKFWGASLLLAIRHMHKNKILYRDIKPENIVVLNDVFYIIINILFRVI
jgi:CRP-like cAMP-binding protein